MSEKQSWKLDNAALIFPAIQNGSHNMLFRISADFRDDIDPELLRRALEDTLRRMPHFRVKMRTGVFWYYFDENDGEFPLERDVVNPLRRMNFRRLRGYLFRIRWDTHRIAGEFFHSLCDATSAMTFMRTLWARYLFLAGDTDSLPDRKLGVLDCADSVTDAELEDAFVKNAEKKAGQKRKESRAWHLKGERLPDRGLSYITFTLDSGLLHSKAKELGVTVNEYVSAVIIEVLYGIQRRGLSRKEIKLSVPVNMRRYFATDTLRNFSLYANVGINPRYGEYDFPTIAREISAMLRYKLQPKQMTAQMASNVAGEKAAAVRAVPLFIKRIVLSTVYLTASENQFTTNYSGLGVIRLTDAMEKHITGLCFMLGAPRYNTVQVSGLTYKDRFYLTVTSVLADKTFQRELARSLVKKGFGVKIEDNG